MWTNLLLSEGSTLYLMDSNFEYMKNNLSMTVGKRRMAMISEMILNTIIKIKEKLALQHGVLCESCFLAVLLFTR